MKIAFNALSAKAGAGVSVFQMLMPAIAKLDKKNNYYIIVSKNQQEIIKDIPDNFGKIILNHVPNNPYLRVLYEQFILPFVLLKNRIDLLYSVGNTTVLLAPTKIVLFIENTNPFTKIVNNWSFKEKLRNKLLFYLTKLSAKRANKIRFCSKRSRDIICKMINIPTNKTFIIYHGIDIDTKKLKDTNRKFEFNYILGLSVVAPHKNFELLIKGFNILKTRYQYNGKLLIVGDTCYKDYYVKLQNLIKDLKLKNDIIFTGKIPHEEVFNYYLQCDAFVFPSLEETFGIPLIEALSLGVPTIASDGTKYNNLFIPFNELAGEYAIYFDPYSEEDLAEKINMVLSSEELKNKFKENAKIFRAKYDISIVASELIKEFNSIGGNK